MKTSANKSAGSVLVLTLVTTGLMGIALASYLTLVRAQNLTVMRSLQWNQSLPVAEAGIEEALVHLTYVGTNNRAVNGWRYDDGVYKKERWVGSNKFVTTISTSSNSPTIISKGYVKDARGAVLLNTPRTIKVTTTNDALFAKGMVAKGTIDLKGNSIRTDSFDSSNTNYSTNGRYDPAKALDHGDIATNSGLTNSLLVGNAEIFGKASTGPKGSVAIGTGGGVGSKAYLDSGNHGAESGHLSDDMNVAFQDVKPPFTGGASIPISGLLVGTNYNYVLASGNYQLSGLSMSGSDKMLITGDAVLYVTGDFSLTGNAQILLATNATLRLYVAGQTTRIGGNGITNPNDSAFNFSYYGLPTNTRMSIDGNASFTGTIYAPQADLTIGGGGSDTYDFVGASVTGSVMMNGHYHFHYDEALGPYGPRRTYVVTSWNEI
jgi:hypothetical protein